MAKSKEPITGQNPDSSKPPAEMGRPTIYDPVVVAKLCTYLAVGESLRTACRRDGMPSMPTVFRWLSASNTEPWAADFREQYARAKEEAADAMAEDILDIADNGTNDWTSRTDKHGNEYEVVNSDVIQRSRLRVDTRKWLMAKMKPKKYGDKLDLTSGGDKIERGMSIEEINAVLARADAEKAAETADNTPQAV